MNPFSTKLKSLRIERGFRQVELAEKLGYEQSYVSAVELGIKGPPADEFLARLVCVLNLSEEERKALYQAVAASKRKIHIPQGASQEVYWLLYKLSQKLDHLHPTQISLIETALNLPFSFNQASKDVPTRITRRDIKTHQMEAEM